MASSEPIDKPVQVLRRPRRFRRRVVRLVAILAVLVAAGAAIRYWQTRGRFDPNMPEPLATSMTDKAVAENDVATFVRIHDEYWHKRPRFPEPSWPELVAGTVRAAWSTGLTAAVDRWNEFQKDQAFGLRMKWSFLTHSPVVVSHPRIVEAAILQEEKYRLLGESLGALPNARSAGQVPEKLMRLYDTQLRIGEALDQLWSVAVLYDSPDALCDWVIKSMEPGIDVRGLDTTLAEYLKADPSNPFVQRAAGLLRWSQGRFAEAEPLLRSAALALDDDPLGRFAWAESRRATGLSVDPERLMGHTSPENPNFRTQESRRLVFLSKLFEANGMPQRASESAEAAVKIDPWEHEAWFRLVGMRRSAGDAEGASKAAARADSLEKIKTALRKAHEAYRRGDRRPEAILLAIAEADDARWNDVTAAWRAFRKEGGSTMPVNPPRPDLFFAARPTSRMTPHKASDWPWLDAPAESASVSAEPGSSERTIVFEAVEPKDSGLAYAYKSHEGKEFRVADVMGGGVAVFDYDGDGRMDIFFPQGCPFDEIGKADAIGRNKLFRNLGGMKFEDVTAKAGVSGRGYAMGAAVGDFDADGKPDLFVTGYGNTILYRNRGDGTFEDVTAAAGVACDAWTTAAAFADLDGDGDLDLFAVTYVDAPPDRLENCLDNSGRPIHCSPGQFEAQPDKLWENRGDGTFRDVSQASGIAAAERGRGLGLAIFDADGDGRLDLFVANDASPNFLFRNEGGLKFTERAAEAGLAMDGSGKATASMGVVAEDLDTDGRPDIFHTNFLNEPNTFRKNLGDGLFMDATLAAGLSASSLSKTGFGAVAADADRDGFLDLFVANGHLDDQPWINNPMAQKPLFYRGQGAKPFRLIPESAFGYLSQPIVGRGMAAGDFDDDGRVDLVVVHRDAPAALLRNVSDNDNGWIGFDLRSPEGGPPPVGATVTLVAGGRTQVRHVTGGTGYLSQSDPRIVFGLGRSEKVEKVTIAWIEKGARHEKALSGDDLKPGGYRKVLFETNAR